MKNQYFGDIGDYFKYSLLRWIATNLNPKCLGIMWYLTNDDEESKDGSVLQYLHGNTAVNYRDCDVDSLMRWPSISVQMGRATSRIFDM